MYELYYIEWHDAMANIQTWSTEDEAVEWAETSEGLVRHVGWLIKETKHYLLIAGRIGEINTDFPELGGVFKIPHKWVRKKVNISKAISSS